ncbi:DNA polymerase epsilon catalytic subunit A [Arachis hypogaea]|nr:DNA polymerase epsilon catalytic subunit A [Arachis hypogaea]
MSRLFETKAEVMKYYVRRWCKASSDVGIRSIVDWSYNKQQLSSTIQKIVTIPTAIQKKNAGGNFWAVLTQFLAQKTHIRSCKMNKTSGPHPSAEDLLINSNLNSKSYF